MWSVMWLKNDQKFGNLHWIEVQEFQVKIGENGLFQGVKLYSQNGRATPGKLVTLYMIGTKKATKKIAEMDTGMKCKAKEQEIQ